MIEPIIFTISSKFPQEGKSTLATLMAKAINEGFNNKIYKNYEAFVFNFADSLKYEIAKAYNLDVNRLFNDSVYKAEHRDKLISYSNELRKINPKCWIMKLMEEVNKIKTRKQPIILIPDRRYFNENFDDYKINKLIEIFIHTSLPVLKLRINNDKIFLNNILLQYSESQRELKPDNYIFDYEVSNDKSLDYLSNVGKCIIMEELK